MWVHQDAWFSLGKFETEKSDVYSVKKNGNGLYAIVLNGEVEIEGEQLSARDGMGIWDTDSITLKSLSKSRVLLMDVPMSL